MKVIKKDGKNEEFVREKIVVSMVKSGARLDMARAIAQEVEKGFAGRDTVSAEEIRREVLNRLKEKDRKSYDSWLAYDAANKKG